MQKILVPFDGSHNALRAVRYAVRTAQEKPTPELELLHVLDLMSHRSHATLTNEEINDLYASEADQVLQPARQILDQAGISYQARYRVGAAASEIAAQVHEAGCDGVVMGTRGMGPIAVMIGSVASRTNTSANTEEFVLLKGTSSELSAAGMDMDMGMVEAVPCPLPSPDDAASMGTDSSPIVMVGRLKTVNERADDVQTPLLHLEAAVKAIGQLAQEEIARAVEQRLQATRNPIENRATTLNTRTPE